MNEFPKAYSFENQEETFTPEDAARKEKDRLPEKRSKLKKALMALTLMAGIAVSFPSKAHAETPKETPIPKDKMAQQEALEEKNARIISDIRMSMEYNNPARFNAIKDAKTSLGKQLIEVLHTDGAGYYNLNDIENDPDAMTSFLQEVVEQSYRETVLKDRGIQDAALRKKTESFWDEYRKIGLSEDTINKIKRIADQYERMNDEEKSVQEGMVDLMSIISKIKDRETQNKLMDELITKNQNQ